MKKLVSVCLFIIGVFSAAASAWGVEIGDWISVPDKPHPRIFFDREEIPEIRRFARENPNGRKVAEEAITLARLWVDRAIEVPRGSVTGLDEEANEARQYHRMLRQPLEALALAYTLTDEEAYARKVKEILLQYAERYKTYSFPGSPHGAAAPSDANDGRLSVSALVEATFASVFALAYDMVADSGVLSEREKATIERDMLRELNRTLQWSKTWNEGGKPTEWPNNSNHGSHRNEAIAMLGYALGDEILVNDAITGPLGMIMQMKTLYYDDGFLNEESPTYHMYALAGHISVAETALNNGVDLYRAIPELKRNFEIPLQLIMPDGDLPPIGDGHRRPLRSSDYALAWLRFGDDRFASSFAGKDAYEGPRGEFLLYDRFDPKSAPKPEPLALESVEFEEAGMSILRSGGCNQLYSLLLYGPHGGNHGHRDKLAVLFHGMGAMLGHDERPEYRIHWRNNWFRQTFAHNTVAVDQQWQRTSRGQSEGMRTTPLLKLSSASADDAYDGVRHARNVLMIGDRYAVIVDALEADRERVYDWCYRSLGALHRAFPLQELSFGNLPPYRAAGGQLAILEDVRESPSLESWSAEWRQKNAVLRISMPAGLGETKVFTGDSPRYAKDGEEARQDGLIWDVPMVFARRKSESTIFAAALEPRRSGREPAAEIELLTTQFPLAMRLSWEDGSEDVVTLFHPREIATPGQRFRSDRMRYDDSNDHYLRYPELDSRASYVRREEGMLVAIAGLDAQRVEVDGLELSYSPQTSFSMEREGKQWTFYHAGKAGVEITLGNGFKGSRIYKGDADRALMTKELEGETTFALEGNRGYRIVLP